MKKHKRKSKTNKPATLCWTCAKACGGCSWSDGTFTPVEGWDAKETKVWIDHSDGYGRFIDSFYVKACPQYVSDKDQFKYANGEEAWYK